MVSEPVILGCGRPNQINTSHQELMKMMDEVKELLIKRASIINSSSNHCILTDEHRPPPAPPHQPPELPSSFTSELSPTILPRIHTTGLSAPQLFDESSVRSTSLHTLNVPTWIPNQSQFHNHSALTPQTDNQQHWPSSHNPNHMAPLHPAHQYTYFQPHLQYTTQYDQEYQYQMHHQVQPQNHSHFLPSHFNNVQSDQPSLYVGPVYDPHVQHLENSQAFPQQNFVQLHPTSNSFPPIVQFPQQSPHLQPPHDNAHNDPLHQDGQFNGVESENIANEQDLNNSQCWENLYPGWKYDNNTGQWVQVDGYDATTNVQENNNSAVHENSEVSSLQQSAQSAVASLPESGTAENIAKWNQHDSNESVTNWNQKASEVGDTSVASVSNWNQISQVNNGYSAHMIFDPQYPGWYHDSISQEWKSLEAYISSTTSNIQAESHLGLNGYHQIDATTKDVAGNDNSGGSFGNYNHQTSNSWHPDTVVSRFGSSEYNDSLGNHAGPILSVVNIMEVVNESIDAMSTRAGIFDYFHSPCVQKFPGPLSGVNVTNKELNKWTDERIAYCESSDKVYSNRRDVKLLLSLLKIACQHYGRLRSTFGSEINSKVDGPDIAIARLFASATRNNSQINDYGAPLHCLQKFPLEEHLRATAAEVQTLLVSGRKQDALHCAQENQLWGPALALAAQLGKKLKEGEPDELALENMESVSPSSPLPMFGNSELNDNFCDFIKKKLRVWCQLQNGEWKSGQIQSLSTETANVLLANGSLVTMSAENLLPANPDVIDGVDDVMELSYINEPSVLHNLQYRYSRDMIYSMSGPVLISINPFKKVELYGNEYATAYRQKLLNGPHVYAVADAAYSEMMRDGVNQSIVISGESGSGKTETANIAMQYLGALGVGDSGIGLKLIHASHILEEFGNAKTSMSDNSSRFGKLTEICFDAMGNTCGAKIQTFLLEQSRVVHLASGERSYHIFYQLCSGAPHALKEKLNLRAASEYSYLNQNGCLGVDNIDDAQRFQKLLDALSMIGMSKEDQDQVFEVVAAVLWLGNISFQCINGENHVEVVADEASATMASLIGCPCEDLMFILSNNRIQTDKNNLAKNLILQQAIDKKNALAKFLYASLFEWLVDKINRLIGKGERQTGRSISIIDIFGFESFQTNSLEQLCINYASERLQQHFIRHLLKLQQEEYDLDGIEWTKVEYRDNKECLDLFEKRKTGLISLLDEESNLAKTSNLTFAEKLSQNCKTNPCFKGEQGGTFTIRHYAGEVLYNTSGFLEKNRESLHSDTLQLLSSSCRQLPQLFASNTLNRCNLESSLSQFDASVYHQQSVGTKFKAHLFKLMQQLENSTPHFIRCIKPNSKQISGIFEPEFVLKQLRCCEILQVVRISRFGYPTRMTHQEFAERYGVLSKFGGCQDPLSVTVSVLQQFGVHPDMYQVGYRKLYFRAGQICVFEEARKQVLQGTLELQRCFRCHQAQRYFHELKKGVISMQSFVRAANARKKYNYLINLREQVFQKSLDEQQRAVLRLQAVIRGWLARKQFKILQELKRCDQEDSGSSHNPHRRMSDIKKESNHQALHVVMEELRRRVLKAETSLEKKEQENVALRDQVQQYEARWFEYEGKMKLMEDMWHKQTTSLQMSLAAVKKSLADSTALENERQEGSLTPHDYDSEDQNSMETQTSGGTPMKLTNSVSESGAWQQSNGSRNAVSHLLKEFEQRKQTFDAEAKAIIEFNSDHLTCANPDKELRSLKNNFEAWMKDYKARLREAKAKLHKQSLSDAKKCRRRKWCGGISKW